MNEVIGLLSLKRFKTISFIFIMPHLMRILSTLTRRPRSILRPKKIIIKKNNDIDYKQYLHPEFKEIKQGKSHQDMMVEYYTRNGTGGGGK